MTRKRAVFGFGFGRGTQPSTVLTWYLGSFRQARGCAESGPYLRNLHAVPLSDDAPKAPSRDVVRKYLIVMLVIVVAPKSAQRVQLSPDDFVC